MTLLLSEVQQGASTGWRHHYDGVEKLIALRGGIREVARPGRLDALLRLFISYVLSLTIRVEAWTNPSKQNCSPWKHNKSCV
jgi:hypothetical protein